MYLADIAGGDGVAALCQQGRRGIFYAGAACETGGQVPVLDKMEYVISS